MATIRSAANDVREIQQELRGLKAQQLVADPATAVNAYQYRQHWSFNGNNDNNVNISVTFKASDSTDGTPYTSAWLQNVSVPETDYVYCEDWWVALTRSAVGWTITLPNVAGAFSGDVVVNSYVAGQIIVSYPA